MDRFFYIPFHQALSVEPSRPRDHCPMRSLFRYFWHRSARSFGTCRRDHRRGPLFGNSKRKRCRMISTALNFTESTSAGINSASVELVRGNNLISTPAGTMYVLTCKEGDRLVVDNDTVVTVVSCGDGRVCLGVEASPHLSVDRVEVHDRKRELADANTGVSVDSAFARLTIKPHPA